MIPSYVLDSCSPPARCNYGVSGLNEGSYYATVGAGTGIPGVATGFHILAEISALVYSLPIGTYVFAGNTSTSVYGWTIRIVIGATSISTSWTCVPTGGGAASASPVFTLKVSDFGKPLHVAFVNTGSALLTYVNGVQATGSTAITGAAPSLTTMFVGRTVSTSSVLGRALILALAGGAFVPTAGEIATSYTQTKLTGQLAPVPAKVDHAYYPYQAVRSYAPCVLLDQPGLAGIARQNMSANTPSVTTHPTLAKYGAWVGAHAFTTTARYLTAVSAGIAGSATTGLHVRVLWLCEAQTSSATRTLASKATVASFLGWDIYTTGSHGALQARVGKGTAFTTTASYTITSGDVGRVMVIDLVVDIPNLRARLYIDSVQVGSGTPITAYSPSTVAMSLGYLGNTATQAATDSAIFGIYGSNSAPSSAELAAAYTADIAAFDLTGVPGKTEHIWSVKKSAALFGPALIADAVGSAHLTFVGAPLRATVQPQLWSRDGLSFPAVGDRLLTNVGGGIAGSASGHWVRVALRIHDNTAALINTNRSIVGRTDWGTEGGFGWMLNVTGINKTFGFIGYGSSGAVSTPVFSTSSGDYQGYVGRIIDMVMRYTGSAIELWVNGIQVGASIALTGFVPYSGAMWVGSAPPISTVSDGLTVLAVEGGLGVPTATQLATASRELAMYRQFSPIGTITDHRWIFDAASSTYTDTIGSDTFTAVGSPVLLNGTEQIPQSYGVHLTTTASLYSTASPAGIAGSASGFSASVFARPDIQSGVAATAKRLAARSNGTNAGWEIIIGAGNTTIFGQLYNGIGTPVSTSVYTLPSSEVARERLITVSYDGTLAHLYIDDAEVGTGTTCSGYTPYSGPTTIGSANIAPASSTLLGLMGGAGVPTFTEIRAAFAACKLARDIVAIGGKSDHLWSFKQSHTGASPTTVTDQIGSDHMTKTGSPIFVPGYGMQFAA